MSVLYIKLSNSTFIRKKSGYIYLFNQINKNERYYNIESTEFINTLTKKARIFDEIIDELHGIFDEDFLIIKKDYLEFIKDLEADGFVVTGKSVKELIKKEPVFSYKNLNQRVNKEDAVVKIVKESNNDNLITKNIEVKDELYIENLYLEVTRCCNENCIHCYIPEEQKITNFFISINNAKKYLDQAKELGVWQITITGGEPFLHPQINEILKYARKKDFIITVLSNLTVLNKTHINTLKEIYPSHIQVSLYSLNSSLHDTITGLKGSLKKTFETINLCIVNDIPIQINCPIIELNQNDFASVLDWAKEKRIKANTDFNILAQTDFSQDNMINTLSEEGVKKVYSNFLAKDKESFKEIQQVIFNEKELKIPMNKHVCGAAYNTLFISSKGKVFPCAAWQSLELGDLGKDTLKNIYFKSRASKKVRNIKFKDYCDVIKSELVPFIKVCPAHNANSFNGDYKKIPDDVFKNAELKYESALSVINKINKKNG